MSIESWPPRDSPVDVALWEPLIGGIGGSVLSKLLLLRREKFFAFEEDAINGLGWTGIQAESTRFHAS